MTTDSRLRLVHLFPVLMGTYGDGGNIDVLVYRAQARGLDSEVVTVGPEDAIPGQADLYLLGGGEDAGQMVAAQRLSQSEAFNQACAAGATILAICAGLQVLGQSFEVAGGQIQPGVGLLDAVTRRRQPRAVGEVIAEPLGGLDWPYLTGYENHGGGTTLGEAATPLARVTSGIGNGIPGPQGQAWEGAIQGHIMATYLHGPVLARNPAMADHLLTWATGLEIAPLEAPLVEQLRAERLAYATSGKLSAEAAATAKRRRWPRNKT